MPNTYWIIEIPHSDGNWGVFENLETALLYIVNRFGKVSNFNQDTPFEEMFFWSNVNKAWTWKGDFQYGIYVQERKYDGFAVPNASELVLRTEISDSFFVTMKRKELEKHER